MNRFLNVVLLPNGPKTRIGLTGLTDLCEVLAAVKSVYGDGIPFAAAYIQLFDISGILIDSFGSINSLAPAYFIEGSSCLEIRKFQSLEGIGFLW